MGLLVTPKVMILFIVELYSIVFLFTVQVQIVGVPLSNNFFVCQIFYVLCNVWHKICRKCLLLLLEVTTLDSTCTAILLLMTNPERQVTKNNVGFHDLTIFLLHFGCLLKICAWFVSYLATCCLDLSHCLCLVLC